MGSAPQFSLRWNNYVSHVTDAFQMLRLDNDMVDVTLCCDGGKIKAHKMLLSVCSDYFKQIFKENPCQHPVIIFKNVKFEDLNAIINFMYHGEVNVYQEQLASFLITADLLEIKGLTDNSDEEASSNVVTADSVSLDLSSKVKNVEYDPVEPVVPVEPINLASIQPKKDDNIPLISTQETVTDDNIEKDLLLNETSQIDNAQNVLNTGTTEEMQVDNMAEDLSDKNNSDPDIVFRCHICPKGFKHPTSLTLHKDSHTGKTQCPVCLRFFSRSYDMRSHLQRIHQGKQLTIKEIRYKSSNDKQFANHIQ